MSEILEYKYSNDDPKTPPGCEKLTTHFYEFTHNDKQIYADAFLFSYLSDRVRYCIKANSIQLAYEMDNFIRYEYRVEQR